MKVLMFGWEFPPNISGGLGTACYGLTKSLAQNDVEVLFVMPRAMGNEDDSIGRIISASEVDMPSTQTSIQEFWSNVSFLPINSGLIPYLGMEEYADFAQYTDGTNSRELKHLGGKYTFSGKYGSNLMEEVARYAYIAAKIARENDFDVIHAHDWLTYLAGTIAKKISGKPLVVHVHATEFDRSGENINRMVYDLEKTGMENADAVITVSNLTRNIVINRYGINPEKVMAVHNAVDFSTRQEIETHRMSKKKIVTFLGRITYQKGPEYFIEAAHKVLQKNNNVHFVMAGNGDMMNKMVRRVAKLRMGSQFSFTGFLKGDNVHKMYALSDVYVMPSVSEPFGISPLEAIESGVPTIVSYQSGVAEILDNALKVNFWDVNALADAINSLTSHSTLANCLQKNGQKEVDALTWSDNSLQVKAIYEKVISA